MELVTGALPAVLAKLGELLVGEYNLQKEAKNGLKFLQAELDRIKAALEDVSKVPVEQLKEVDKIWAREARELSYDIEDSIEKFTVECEASETAKQRCFNDFIAKTLDKLTQPKIRRRFATEVRGIKRRIEEVYESRDQYNNITADVAKPVKIDPRLLVQYKKATELVGIDEARDELIQLLLGEGDKASNKQQRIVSIVGFGGLGKTSLANVVYENLKAQFDCSAFISVSQAPDVERLLKDIQYQLTKTITNASINVVIKELREFLQKKKKRYFIVIDDIWDIQHWKIIRCALPDNDFGCKIITTTRIWNIAKEVGGAYNMRPLSLDNSRILLYRRIFGIEDEEKSYEEDLTVDRILKKCAGVPLAIITIGSLLASQGRNKWYEVYSSIGTGMENSLDMENMRKILLLSYYHLPFHLRTCLMYLSFFPEDYEVDKDRVIWMWIAEGFIKCEKQVIRLYEVGQSYLNELINRSMVQPIYTRSGELSKCRVHDIVLEVVRSLSSEENFIVVNDLDHRSSTEKVRRLSLQNGKINHFKPGTMEQVRSLVVFPSAVNVVPPIMNFRVLRVLDLQGCDLSKGYGLNHLGKLYHLRYLGLGRTDITQLPKEIGNLQLLMTLDLMHTHSRTTDFHGHFYPPTTDFYPPEKHIASLPSTIPQLGNLTRLLIDSRTRVEKGIRSLTSLEELSEVAIEDFNTDIIEELGDLTELRVLFVKFKIKSNEELNRCLMESLQKLQKIQRLAIKYMPGGGNLDGWVVVPCHLRTLQVYGFWFSTLPAFIDPLKLLDLCHLVIFVRRLQAESLEILGRLPSLRHLHLHVDQIIGGFVVGAGLFSRLLLCEIHGNAGHVAFHEGAMPSLTTLWITFSVRVARNIPGIKDLGLGNLPSLEYVRVSLLFGGASKEEVEEWRAALIHAAEIHPNRPRYQIT